MLSNRDKLRLAYKICNAVFELDLKKRDRKRNYVYARACYFVLARKYTFCSLEEIGGFIDRHHATVIHSTKEFKYMCKFDSKIADSYAVIEQRFLEKMEDEVVEQEESPAEVLKMRLSILEAELKKLRMVEREYLKLTKKKAVVYNEHIDKLVLL